MIVYFARPEDWIPGLAVVPLAKITGLLILLALAFSFSEIRWNLPREVTFLILLITQLWFAAVLSSVWKAGAVNVMVDFSKVLPLALVIYAAVRSTNRLRWILFVQAASVAAIAFASIVNRHAPGGRLQGALSGIYANPNDLALVIDLTLPICLALAVITRSIWGKVAWALAMIAMIYAVFLTASRGGAIALVIAAMVCLWQVGFRDRRFYLFLLVPVAVLGILVYGGNSLKQRFEQTKIDSETNRRDTEASGSAQERKELLVQSLKVTAQHPVFGIGPGNFVIVSGVWHVSHNSYTQISAEGGIPAFLLYLLIFWRASSNLRRIRKYPRTGKAIQLLCMALEASLAAYLVGSFFGSLAYQLFPYCLVAHTSSLLLITHRERLASSGTPKSQVTPAQVEVTVWQ